MAKQQIVTVVGGSGFIGRYVVRELVRAGYTVRVLCRHPELAQFLKPMGDVGQIVIEGADITRPETFEAKLKGSYAVINLTGILFERSRQSFSAVHAQGAEKLAKEAWKSGAKRFIQISAIGANKSQNAKYSRSKSTGEKAVAAAFNGATIIRPSVVFGPEDNFFNKFACMATYAPALPLIGSGKTRFQPVYVGDVAQAVLVALEDAETVGETYELGGPRVMSFREILQYILQTTGRCRPLITLPFSLASLKAMFLEFLPTPPLTRDQVQLLKYDNVVDKDARTFADLGITPTPIETVVPDYLARYSKRSASQSV